MDRTTAFEAVYGSSILSEGTPKYLPNGRYFVYVCPQRELNSGTKKRAGRVSTAPGFSLNAKSSIPPK
ncbi:MAG: hypothetical protein QG607_531 [Patescibacteria group bacterium]|nr:hypothetical protein [Patescibacteria group bacterium]